MDAQREMPRYRCHKEVWALKIKSVETRDDGVYIVPDDEGYAAFRVTWAFVEKHSPSAGGYYVQYGDGYASFSPGKAFEDGYTRI